MSTPRQIARRLRRRLLALLDSAVLTVAFVFVAVFLLLLVVFAADDVSSRARKRKP